MATVAQGKVTGVAAGVASIGATLSGKSASAQITVSAAKPKALVVAPSSVSLPIGGTKQLAATLQLDDGSMQDVTSVAAWSSGNPGVASVATSGLVTGTGAGGATVTASTAGLTASAQVTVSSAVLTAVALSPEKPSVGVGQSIAFTALGLFSDGTSADVTATASWTSSAAGVFKVDGGGTGTALATGTATVSATVGAITGSTLVTVSGTTLTGNSNRAVVRERAGRAQRRARRHGDVLGRVDGRRDRVVRVGLVERRDRLRLRRDRRRRRRRQRDGHRHVRRRLGHRGDLRHRREARVARDHAFVLLGRQGRLRCS
ncbi:MAG: Ig-like domain-containing protein [Dermatophilaceae bacterium]